MEKMTITRVSNGWILDVDEDIEKTVVASEGPELIARVMEWAVLEPARTAPAPRASEPVETAAPSPEAAPQATNGAARHVDLDTVPPAKKERKPRITKAQAEAERAAGLRPPLKKKPAQSQAHAGQ